MDELRTAAWPQHRRLEKRLDVAARFTTLSGYRNYLVALWGFHEALETRITPELIAVALPDYPQRRKLPLLAHDLEYLGLTAEAVSALPTCAALPRLPDTASALGCIYVLEGATHGGRSLLPLVALRLTLGPRQGTTFLASYREDVDLMWQRFGASVNAWCGTVPRRRQAAAAAQATFDSLSNWICGARA